MKNKMSWEKIFRHGLGVMWILVLASGCGVPAATPMPASATPIPPTQTPNPSATSMPPTHTPAPISMPEAAFPFSEPGPYQYTSLYGTVYHDQSRAGREVAVTIIYPIKNDAPDLSAAPYPLILSTTKLAHIFGGNLASYGFVVVGVNNLDYYMLWNNNLVDQPLDILFALDQVASNPPDLLKGMIDSEHAGTLGYSFDGYNSLAVSGARVDPEWYLARCANPPALPPIVVDFGVDYYCNLAKDWEAFVSHAGETLTTSQDGLWQPMTDPRILAVMPMGVEGVWLFGDRGLAAVDRPILIIQATEDQLCPYETEAVYVYEHAGTPERYLISVIGRDHYIIMESEQTIRLKHFSVAFFGYYLQGRQDFKAYFSEEFVSKQEGLAWGVYGKP